MRSVVEKIPDPSPPEIRIALGAELYESDRATLHGGDAGGDITYPALGDVE